MARAVTGIVRRMHSLLAVCDANEQSDAELLRRFTEQADADAFESIVRRHGPMVLGVCRRLLGNAADADDAFQAAFVVLIRKAASLSRPERLAGWLFQVADRTARRARSLRQRRHENCSPLQDVQVDSPIAAIVWAELRPVFDEEICRLPEKLRLPIVLCFLEGRSKRTAARMLGWPEGTFSCRLQQARELLRCRLARRGVTLSAGTLSLAVIQATASAAVPSTLLSSTIQSASLVAAGTALSAPIAALTQGVIHSMFMTKLKIVAALVLTAGVLSGGTELVLYGGGDGNGAFAGQPELDRPERKAPPRAAEQDPDKPQGSDAGPEKARADKERLYADLMEAQEVVDRATLALAKAEQVLRRAKVAFDAVNAKLEAQMQGVKAPPLPETRAAEVNPPKDVRIGEAEVVQREADLNLAKVKLDVATKEVARLKPLGDVVPQTVIDAAEGKARLAEAEVRQAQAALERAHVILVYARKEAKVEPSPDVPAKKNDPLSSAEQDFNRWLKLKSAGAVSDSDVDRARIKVAAERILAELQTIVDLRRKESARCKQLFEAKAISSDELKQAAKALDASERRLAEWQQNEPIIKRE